MSVTSNAIDPRKRFEETLVRIGESNPAVVAVSCDSASGGGLGAFFKRFPERSVEVGISEQNAVGISAAMAQQGFIPVVVAITPFLTMRAYEQVRDDVGYMNANVKLVGSGGGLAYSTLGSTHEALEDIALMRTIPHLTILSPGDAHEVEKSLEMAVEFDGPVYIRMPRQARSFVKDPATRSLKIGEAEVLRDGKDITLFAVGPMAEEAVAAADILKDKGIDISVVNLMTVKPLDEAAVLKFCGRSRMVFSVEEHSTVNGLGTAIAQLLAPVAGTPPLHIFGVEEGEKMTGPYKEVLEYYGLTGPTIAARIEELL
jgi:transketolase